VPDDRTVVLGLVTTKRPGLENKESLKQRIRQASEIIPMERLAISPQCGFASTIEGNRLTSSEQEAKLRLIGDTAREVWGVDSFSGVVQRSIL
jgi:5-methyltetrahydropteroyltriglutamate--homocysteine methyltransferase